MGELKRRKTYKRILKKNNKWKQLTEDMYGKQKVSRGKTQMDILFVSFPLVAKISI